MKYSIIINPSSEKSLADTHALKFIKAVNDNNNYKINVFFYGYAVKHAFFNHKDWKNIASSNVKLIACSTIADEYIQRKLKSVSYFAIAGLGQWMEFNLQADKLIEFI